MKKILYLLSFLYILSIASVASATWNAYIMGAGVKYRPWDTVPTNTSLTTNAVRGQWASFQIACRVSNEDVSGVDVSVTTPRNGSLLLNTPIIYKQIPYNVIVKSRNDGATGEWFDALVPKVDPYYSETRNVFPFNVNRISSSWPGSTTYVYAKYDMTPGSGYTRVNRALIKPKIGGAYSGSGQLNYHIKIDLGGTLGVATFKWSDDGGASWKQTGIKTGSNVPLNNGLTIIFPSQTYTLNDEWEFFANAFRTEMVWVESFIPINANVGDYTATVTVGAAGKATQTLNLTIKVCDIQIPLTSSLPTFSTGSRDSVSKGHYQAWQSTLHEALYKKYVEAALMHRISLQVMHPILTWNGSTIGNWPNYKSWMAPYMNGTWAGGSALSTAGIPAVNDALFICLLYGNVIKESSLTQGQKDYLTALKALLDAERWTAKYYYVIAEEPNANPPSTTQTTSMVNVSSGVHAIDIGYKAIVTHDLVSQWTGDPVDVWAPWLGFFSPSFHPRSSYDSEVSAGRQIWSYLSCMSKGCYITGGSDYSKWPSHMVDATLPNLRGYYWLLFDNDVKGDLYWQMMAGHDMYHSSYPKLHDPWDGIYICGGDGDGTLFWPGRPDKIGGTTHIPIESIRLKALRMGLEDYEIFKYASDRCYTTYVEQQIESAVGNGQYYYTSPQPSNDAMEDARNNILNLFGQSIPPEATKDPDCSANQKLTPPSNLRVIRGN